MRNIAKLFFILFIISYSLLVITGCGYKPASTYAKEAISGKVFVDIYINIHDPKNTVLIKDAMNEIIASRFKAKLTKDKKEADTLIYLELGSVGLSELQYDRDGYVKLYRATSNIKVNYKAPKKSGIVKVSGNYDFTVDDGTVISDTKRFEAIRTASAKALDEVISKLALESFK